MSNSSDRMGPAAAASGGELTVDDLRRLLYISEEDQAALARLGGALKAGMSVLREAVARALEEEPCRHPAALERAHTLLRIACEVSLLPGGDVEAHVRAVLARLVEAFAAAWAMLRLRSGEDLVLRAHLGLPAELAEAAWTSLLPEGAAEHPITPCAQVVETGRPLWVEDLGRDERFRSSLGASRFGVRSYLGVPVTSIGGEVVGALSVLSPRARPFSNHEVEALSIAAVRLGLELERDARERALREMQKLAAVGHAMSGFAHEINNALTGVIGSAQLLLAGPPNGDLRPDLDAVVRAAKRCCSTAKSLLRFVRCEPPRRVRFDVNGVLSEVIALRSADLEACGLRLELQLAPLLPEIMGDPDQIGQVFLNLLNNAFDAALEAGRKGTIRVTTTVDGEQFLATFEDDGPGIADPSRLFTVFYTTKGREKGTGLGLSVSRKIARTHGGDIVATSLRPRGARFSVGLPLATPKGGMT